MILFLLLAAVLGPFDMNVPPYPDCDSNDGCSHYRCDAFAFDMNVPGTLYPLDCVPEEPLIGYAAKFHITPTTDIVGVCVSMRFCNGNSSDCALLYTVNTGGGRNPEQPQRREQE